MRFLFPTKESEYGLILYKHFKKGLELFGHTVDTIHRKDVTVELIKEYDYTFLLNQNIANILIFAGSFAICLLFKNTNFLIENFKPINLKKDFN